FRHGLARREAPTLAGEFRQRPCGRTLDQHLQIVNRPVYLARRRDAAGMLRRMILEIPAVAGEIDAADKGDALARRLQEPEGPEIFIVVTRRSRGYLEQLVMGGNRDRLLRRLAAADRWGRLRVFYPSVRGDGIRVDIKIHAKLIIIDDRFLRVGSSNLN